MSNLDLSRRIGRFFLPESVMQADWKSMLDIFSTVVVVRCEQLWAYNGFDYTAVSPHFDEIPYGEVPPEYIAHFVDNKFVGWMIRE